MKTDKEIKKWIDSKKVLTKTDLIKFLFDINTHEGCRKWHRYLIVTKWWNYILETKNWGELKSYQQNKINNGHSNPEQFNQLKKIYLKDKRMHEVGMRKITKMLQEIYDTTIPISSVRRYLKLIRGNNEKVSYQ